MEKAEQNMVSFIKEKKENTIKMQLIVLMGIMSTISFITLLVVVCIYTEVISVPVKGILILIACTIFAIGIIAMMVGGCTFGYYECSCCGETFVPGFINFATGMNVVAKKRWF